MNAAAVRSAAEPSGNRHRANISRALVSFLYWDGAPSPRFEQLVDQAVGRFCTEMGRPRRFRVWLERRPGASRRSLFHVRLDMEHPGDRVLQGWQLRAESTGPSPQQCFQAAMRAIAALARGQSSLSAPDKNRIQRRPAGTRLRAAKRLAGSSHPN